MYALVDGNNFCVTCQRVFRARLQGRPVIVLSNNDGVILSRAVEEMRSILETGFKFSKAGVLLLDLKDATVGNTVVDTVQSRQTWMGEINPSFHWTCWAVQISARSL